MHWLLICCIGWQIIGLYTCSTALRCVWWQIFEKQNITTQIQYIPPFIIDYNIPQKIYQYITMSDWNVRVKVRKFYQIGKTSKMTRCCNCSHHTEEGKISKFQKFVSSNPFIKRKNQDNRFFLLSLFSSGAS